MFLTVEWAHVTLFCAHFPTMCAAHTAREHKEALLVSMKTGPEVKGEKTN